MKSIQQLVNVCGWHHQPKLFSNSFGMRVDGIGGTVSCRRVPCSLGADEKLLIRGFIDLQL